MTKNRQELIKKIAKLDCFPAFNWQVSLTSGDGDEKLAMNKYGKFCDYLANLMLFYPHRTLEDMVMRAARSVFCGRSEFECGLPNADNVSFHYIEKDYFTFFEKWINEKENSDKLFKDSELTKLYSKTISKRLKLKCFQTKTE